MNIRDHKSGFVALIGRTNVGKSSFLNFLLKEKVSISSPKPQTTRQQIRGIYNTNDAQIVFIDTPGLHKPKHELGLFMNDEALSTLNNVDIICWMVDATRDFGFAEDMIIKYFQNIKVPIFLLINKIDLVKNKNKLMENVAKYHSQCKFVETYYISSLTGEHIDDFILALIKYLPKGPKYYPSGQITDQNESFIMAEIIREKVLHLLHEEVPHSIATSIENIIYEENAPPQVNAIIYVERDSQKKILIGKDGIMLKEIGTLARRDINKTLGIKIHLNIWVKVEKDWRNKKRELHKLGYESKK